MLIWKNKIIVSSDIQAIPLMAAKKVRKNAPA
jgi:hypothetical protein